MLIMVNLQKKLAAASPNDAKYRLFQLARKWSRYLPQLSYVCFSESKKVMHHDSHYKTKNATASSIKIKNYVKKCIQRFLYSSVLSRS